MISGIKGAEIMFGLSMIELILYLALVVAAVFLVVILIISAVFVENTGE